MIMRTFLLLGLLLLGGTAYFVVVQQPPAFQLPPGVSEITRLQDEGILAKGPLDENEEIEHEVFGVPPEDEEMLELALADMDMGGMDMSGMDMSDGTTMDMGEGTTMDMTEGGAPVLDMDMDGDGVMDMSSAQMNTGGTMNVGDDTTMDMAEGDAPVLDMDMDGDGVMDMSSAQMSTGGTMNMGDDMTMDMTEADAPVLDMDMDGDGVMDMSSAQMSTGGTMNMGDDTTMDVAEIHGDDEDESDEEAERLEAGMMAGLMITQDGQFDREISLSMMEWGFSDLELDVKPGERIKFTLRNEGTIPHEFMFMTMAAMQAVNYRAKRADWNLLEHEALYEKSLLLPGEEITFVAQVTKPGGWMFMCMLPYHMQMGMMGQLATEGMAMSMDM